ncbi:3-oxoacyl-[acyl-carrier-protein] reductase [Alkalibacter mobilis]|uniref:3-oxoacyl-[acyl-carrier-protein] reductase n=1 Tax=Alkalibacter mobilis TaxID=2787712 RepID=UPI00189C7C21|nr:3-oxoacyl-[acyl-carrier-protein] reductase [Alkalibacter mobilis]MBF7095935.1 3-oxoacyl-[acyl-carrier-protein] reductase [Alkalibacter mobilis]
MLENKTAVVTGGTRGIGRAIVLKLSQMGANVVFNYRSNDAMAQELVELIQATGKKALAVKGDVKDFNDAAELIALTVKTFGSIDILVNNAGITKDSLILRMTEEDFDDVINTNLKGTFNCIKHAAKPMLKAKKGRIINMASVIGLIGNPGQANYAASKAGIIGLTKAVAKEFATRGITVNAIAPGFIESDMTDKLSDDQKSAILKNIPAGSLGSAEDVASLVGYLSTDEAKYITGQVINVDGGMVV